MKSKSFDLNQGISEKKKYSKSFDFVGYYKSAAETNVKLADKRKEGEGINKENNFVSVTKPEKSKRERLPKKKVTHEPLDVTQINIDGRNLNTSLNKNSPRNGSKVTSTPIPSKNNAPGVKSIMKNTSVNGDDSMDGSHLEESTTKRKKRNKSVSFMLDDSDAVAIKKTKSDDSLTTKSKSEKSKKDNPKKDSKEKHVKKHKIEKTIDSSAKMITDTNENQVAGTSDKRFKNKDKAKSSGDTTVESSTSDLKPNETQERKKKLKKVKKPKSQVSTAVESESNNDDQAVSKEKKKKKKRSKSAAEAEGEPQTKSRKRETKADISDDLENLSIGDNTHTLTNLLDEMTVVDKEKKKKIKHKSKKDKKPNVAYTEGSDKTELDNSETPEEKEKVKWRKRKWNKDRKGEANEHDLETSVIVDNLPLSIMLTYRKLLTEHFEKCGTIQRIGIAEVYPTEESKPVFTTTIHFDNAEAATKALDEDNTAFEGSRIRVKRPLAPTETTLVVRSYAELSCQNVSSMFTGAGRIRSIRHLVKGKKSMATTFIEFDGPETVDKALKMAMDARIGGKKIYIAKFENRVRKNKKEIKNKMESENEGDSENSND